MWSETLTRWNPRFRRAVLILLILLVAFPLGEWPSVATPADSSQWHHWDEGLPERAYVLTLAIVPAVTETLYAGTYDVPGLWRSMDGGETWQPEGQSGEPGPHNHPVFALLWDAGHETLWAGTTGGLYCRRLNTVDWEHVNEFEDAILSLSVDNAGRLYVIEADDGLFRRDEDDTWVRVYEEPRAISAGISPDGQQLILGTAGSGTWISRDGAKNWQQVGDLGDEYVSALLVDSKEGRLVFASTTRHVYRSVDFGHTWEPISELAERAYAFDYGPDKIIYVGLKGRIARSTDGGETWTVTGKGLHPNTPVTGLVIPPRSLSGYAIYSATRDGIYLSIDGGETWQRRVKGLGEVEVEAVARDGEGGMLAATRLGLYRRSAEAKNWQMTAQSHRYGEFYALASHVSAGVIYAGMGNGLLLSTDGGETWGKVISNLPSSSMAGLLVDPDNPDHLFAHVAFERVYESHDRGRTWEARWEGMEIHHVVLSLARSPSGELWAGTQDGLFRWDRAQGQWQRETLPVVNQSVFAIAFDALPAHGSYIGTTDGLWCNPDGTRWLRCGSQIIRHTVMALALSPDGSVYAGTRYAGLYRSSDRGVAWQKVSGIPDDATVNDLLVDAGTGIVYVATNRGLFLGNDMASSPADRPVGDEVYEEWSEPDEFESISLVSGFCPPVTPLPAAHVLRPDDALLQQVGEIGFQAIVQVFSWEEMEPTRGEWHWEYPDFLVRAADYYGLELIVRLDHPPEWAKRLPAAFPGYAFDVDAYLEFVKRVARRYRGHIRGYVIWNEPNLTEEWGTEPDPVAYTRLLQRAYVAVKRADPFAKVISAGLSPTNECSQRAMDDRVYLKKMYQAGAGRFFDALGAHPYGFAYPPDDPQGAHDGLNMNRILALRMIMDAFGDQEKPVWTTELGWTTHGVGAHAWLTVTPGEQADYLAYAWQRAQTEWPWLNVFTVWNLSRGLSENDEQAGYSLLNKDGTSKPACEVLQEAFATGESAQSEVCPTILSGLLGRPKSNASHVPILARDEELHLGDSE